MGDLTRSAAREEGLAGFPCPFRLMGPPASLLPCCLCHTSVLPSVVVPIMPEITLKIPHIGEGLQEARVVALLKKPGDWINRDEPLYQMETDKAVMDVESSHSGRVVRWLAEADDVLAIGGDILVLETDEAGVSAAHMDDESPRGAVPQAEEALQDLCIPHIGEGLQEARIVALLKQPGDQIKRDEIIYQIETDKAVMDIESPLEGVLVKWTVEVDEVAAIGGVVGHVSGAGTAASFHAPAPAAAPAAAHMAAASTVEGEGVRRTDLPPRTRAYAKSKGLSDLDLACLPITGRNLLESDVDAYLGRSARVQTGAPGEGFTDTALSGKQKILASRLQRGSQLVVPGMMSIVVDWSEIEALRDESKAEGGDFQPSAFTYFAFAVAKAAAGHPVMRSAMVGDSTIRTYDHLQLGIAVALPGDDLVVAVVKDSDSLSWREFADQARAAIGMARQGKDQANERVTLSITNMAGHGIREAMAVVVPPGVATIFLGEAYWGISNKDAKVPGFMRCANVGITIDHRLINGVGGAEFLNAIRTNVEGIRRLIEQ